jgi:hypothetical protein
MSKSALYVLGSDGNITQMFVSESGFNVSEAEPNEYTFSIQDSTIPIHVFDVSDQCKPEQTELSECLNKTEITVTEEFKTKMFYGNVLYLLIPQVSFTKYILDPNKSIIMTPVGSIVAYILPDHSPETTSLLETGTGTETGTETEPGTGTETGTETETGEHEIVVAFNMAKNIADLIGKSNSSNSTNSTASMTPSAWSSFG